MMSVGMSKARVLAGAMLVVAACLPTSAWGGGADAVWVGPPDGSWSVADHWDPAVVPNGSAFNVLIDTNDGVSSSVLLNGDYAVGSMTIDFGDMLRISNARTLIALPGPVHNNGTLQLEASSAYTYFRIDAADVLLDGTGTLLMGNSARNRIYGNAWTNRLTHSEDHTIRGSGNIGANSMLLSNDGLVQADQTLSLVIDLAGDATHENFNTGTMQATDGATLSISGSPINNDSGMIQALDGSVVGLTGSTHIYNGTLATQGSGLLRVTGSAWIESLDQTGTLTVENNASCCIRGTICNTGTIATDAGSSYTYIRLDQPAVSVTGSGSIDLGGSTRDRIHGDAWTHRLTNTGGHTIRGGGNVGANNLLLTNEATIDADRAGATLTVDLGGSDYGSFNTGVMKASGGGVLSLYGSLIDNTGGTITATDASYVDLANGTHIRAGALTSAGTGLIRVPSSQAAYLDSVTHSGHLSIHNAASMRIRGTIVNDGVIGVDSPGSSATFLYLDTPAVTLTGDGEVALAESYRNQITANAWTHRLTHSGNHTIHGGGSFGANNMLLTNAATIRADLPDVTMTLDLNGDAENENFNSGLMEAANQGTLAISGSPINNQDGLIRASEGSVVNLTGSTSIYNGTLSTEGDGLVLVPSSGHAYLTNVTNDGHVSVANAANLRVHGTITNNGSIGVDSPGTSSTYLYLEQSVTFVGDGEVVLNDNSRNAITGNSSERRFTNAGNHTIRGGGSVGTNNMLLTNESLITADREGVTMSVDVTANDESFNSGDDAGGKWWQTAALWVTD